MNEDKYKKAEQVLSKSNLFYDDKELLKSVVKRARHLENEVIKKTVRN